MPSDRLVGSGRIRRGFDPDTSVETGALEPWKGGCRLLYAGLLGATQVYVEKVRPQFLSLRQ
jgi:hypothetical protein